MGNSCQAELPCTISVAVLNQDSLFQRACLFVVFYAEGHSWHAVCVQSAQNRNIPLHMKDAYLMWAPCSGVSNYVVKNLLLDMLLNCIFRTFRHREIVLQPLVSCCHCRCYFEKGAPVDCDPVLLVTTFDAVQAFRHVISVSVPRGPSGSHPAASRLPHLLQTETQNSGMS